MNGLGLEFIFTYGTLSFVLAFVLFPPYIKLLNRYGFSNKHREVSVDGKATPVYKKATEDKIQVPRLGGFGVWLTILAMIGISRIFSFYGIIEQSLLQRAETYLPLFTLITCGFLGFIDDLFNIFGVGKKKGIDTYPKFWWLFLFAAAGAWWFFFKLGYDSIHLPFYGDLSVGWWYIPIFIFVVVSSMHAVNITDGLDGLAPGLLMIAFGVFAAISYFDGLFFLSAFCVTIMGALLAFLWFNVWPARIILGDAGSLGLGGTLAIVALMTDNLVIFPFIMLLFVIDGGSSFIQIISKRFFKKKIFLAAPIHWHLRAIGYSEQNIIMRAWIVAAVLGVVGIIIVMVS